MQDFFAAVEHPRRREEGLRLLSLMSAATGQEALLRRLVKHKMASGC